MMQITSFKISRKFRNISERKYFYFWFSSIDVLPKNENDKCFQYEITVELNYREIEAHPERVSNIKHFINKYNWKGINYPSKIDDWETFEKKIWQLLLTFCILQGCSYNLGHNILRVLDTLPNFLFTTSETKRDCL